jgi:tetratricopeptide (TPR) repeat protein
MAKSSVERYEQLLAQDPTSSVFVELAKALLAKGDAARAIQVCEQGITHHPQSVAGRVQWGKALLLLGRPAEAMSQFDQATAIDKDNPYAYNLIAEVLLQRGLYRSALPILRKASALQPNDARVRGWMEQAQTALSGGPAPVLGALSTEAPPEAPEEAQAGAPPSTAGAETAAAAQVEGFGLGEEDPEENRTVVMKVSAAEAFGLGEEDPEENRTLVMPVSPELLAQSRTAAVLGAEPDTVPGVATAQLRESAAGDAVSPVPVLKFAPPPPPEVPVLGAESPSVPVLSALEVPTGAAQVPVLEALEVPTGAGAQVPVLEALEVPTGVMFPEPVEAEAEPVEGGGLLDELPPLEPLPEAEPLEPLAAAAAPRRATGESPRAGGLLDELPEVSEEEVLEAAPEPVAPQARVPEQPLEVIVAAYEKELKDALLPKTPGPSLRSGRTLKLLAVAAALVVVAVAGGTFFSVRAAQGGRTLRASLVHAERLIAEDTLADHDEALALLAHALSLDGDNRKAWALTAWAHALRYEDTGAAEDRTRALAALAQPGVRQEHPGITAAVELRVAEPAARETARKAVLASKVDSSEVHALAASLLLETGKTKEALERFQRALTLSPRNTRALVALGTYYREASDCPAALKMYAGALQVSPGHPGARVGAAECRLALGQELEAALAEMEGLAGDETLPAPVRVRQPLVHGRLLSALGQHAEARKVLTPGTKGPLAYESLLALGEAGRGAGDMPAAQKAFEEALRLKPDSEEAKAGLGWALLERDMEKEALAKLGTGGGPVLARARAAAYARTGEWKRVRTELARVRVGERYPPEAIAWLALADAAEGEREQARAVLERVLGAVKSPRGRGELRLALGLVRWQEGAQDEAAKVLAAVAREDAHGYEGPCALGRLLVSRGQLEEALEPLKQAVARNGSHGEAREVLGRTLLALGRTEEGLKQFESWQLENPGVAAAHKGFARALYASGRMKEAEAASGRAVKLATGDAEAHRLRATILFATGDGKAAFSALETANRLDTKSAETFCEIALGFMRLGNAVHAGKAFEAARREGPTVPCGQVGGHYAKPSGGRAAAQALADIAAKAPSAWDKAFAEAARARVLLEAGALKEARAAADESVRWAPFSGRSHLALGLVAFKQRDAAAAVKALSRAVELEPVDGLAWLALADALAPSPAEAARAVKAYQTFLSLAGASPEAARVKRALPALERQGGR